MIADTHGLLRSQVATAFAHASLIIHAGDIGHAEVLAELNQIAPVIAVRGNNDNSPWAAGIPLTQCALIAGVSLQVVHNLADYVPRPSATPNTVVITGHSHKPSHVVRAGVHYVNPGSAGPRRFKLPVTVARLHLDIGLVTVEVVDLMVPPDSTPLASQRQSR